MALPKLFPIHASEEDLEEYIFGRLDLQARARISRHLEHCEVCAKVFFAENSSIRELKRALRLAEQAPNQTPKPVQR